MRPESDGHEWPAKQCRVRVPAAAFSKLALGADEDIDELAATLGALADVAKTDEEVAAAAADGVPGLGDGLLG